MGAQKTWFSVLPRGMTEMTQAQARATVHVGGSHHAKMQQQTPHERGHIEGHCLQPVGEVMREAT